MIAGLTTEYGSLPAKQRMQMLGEANDLFRFLIVDDEPSERRFNKLIRNILLHTHLEICGIWLFETKPMGFSFELDLQVNNNTAGEIEATLHDCFPHSDIFCDLDINGRSMECIITKFIPDSDETFWYNKLEITRKQVALNQWMLHEIKVCLDEAGFDTPVPMEIQYNENQSQTINSIHDRVVRRE